MEIMRVMQKQNVCIFDSLVMVMAWRNDHCDDDDDDDIDDDNDDGGEDGNIDEDDDDGDDDGNDGDIDDERDAIMLMVVHTNLSRVVIINILHK